MVIAVFQSQSGSTDTIHVEIVTSFCGLRYGSLYGMDRVTYIVCGMTLSDISRYGSTSIMTQGYLYHWLCAC
jgi:hypothetical protein